MISKKNVIFIMAAFSSQDGATSESESKSSGEKQKVYIYFFLFLDKLLFNMLFSISKHYETYHNNIHIIGYKPIKFSWALCWKGPYGFCYLN